jgi:hypothetical protein
MMRRWLNVFRLFAIVVCVQFGANLPPFDAEFLVGPDTAAAHEADESDQLASALSGLVSPLASPARELVSLGADADAVPAPDLPLLERPPRSPAS